MNTCTKAPETIYTKEDLIRNDYGDWQTSYDFAKEVCLYLKKKGITPEVIVEPTCGLGNFIAAAIDVFNSIEEVYAVEICQEYISKTDEKLKQYKKAKRIKDYRLYHANVFTFDFEDIINKNQTKKILVLGNPPWVTNSGLGKANGTNLPMKGNINKVKGIEAITGKGNFDIAESICNLLIDSFSHHSNTHIALLVKNSVIKNILYRQHTSPRPIQDIKQLGFDAKKEFNVAVAASLFDFHIGSRKEQQCVSYNFYTQEPSHTFGWVEQAFVSNTEAFDKTKFLDGQSPLVWRSGIKHDCSKVMELIWNGTTYVNGLKETVDVNDNTVFPLLKSSDIGKGMKGIRKYLVLPQTNISENTEILKEKAPQTYSYLLTHAAYLDGRKSIIYRNKPRFSVFGLGDYSFAPYKVVISALYSELTFSMIGPINGKPVMVDDTCYLLGFKNADYAKLTLFILQSNLLKCFIRNICFMDAKRIVNRELLMRIDLYQLSKHINYKGIDITPEKIQEYQQWLYQQTNPGLFALEE